MNQIIGVPILNVNRNSDLNIEENRPMSIGTRIREARRRAGLTQKQLAVKVGMAQGSLSELETGESAGSTLIATLAAALGVNALWLETGKGLPDATNYQDAQTKPTRMILAFDDEQRLLDLFRRCDDRGRDEILQFSLGVSGIDIYPSK